MLEKLGQILQQATYSLYELIFILWNKLNDVIENVNNKTDNTGDHKGTWQGLKPTQAIESIPGILDQHTAQINSLINNTNSVVINVMFPPAPYAPLKTDGSDNFSLLDALMVNFHDAIFFFPDGDYYFSDLIIKNGNSIIGAGYTTVFRKATGSYGAVMRFNPTSENWHRQLKLSNFRIVGLGSHSSDGTTYNVGDTSVDGLLLNAYYGCENLEIDNIFIQDCGGTAFNVIPQNTTNEQMLIQQSNFKQIHTQFNTNGCKIKGFVGNVMWDSCTFEKNVEKAFIVELGDGGAGAQDNVFINCAFQFSKYGFYSTVNFINFVFKCDHFEGNTVADIYTKNNSNVLTFEGLTMAKSLVNFYFDSFSGVAHIDDIYLNGDTNNAATGTHIKVVNTSGLIFVGFNIKYVNMYTTPIDDASNRLRINKDWSNTLFMDNLRVNNGISSSATRAKNFCGQTSVTSGQAYIDVSINAESDTAYRVSVLPWWNTTCWITNKTVNSFRVNFGTAPGTTGLAIEWHMFR
jgi:hypothetical protein